LLFKTGDKPNEKNQPIVGSLSPYKILDHLHTKKKGSAVSNQTFSKILTRKADD